jgi:Protein of unknown function (DUF3592)
MASAGLILVLIGVVGLLLAVWRFDRLRRFDARAQVAQGRVIGVHEERLTDPDGELTTIDIPIVRFKTRDGRIVDARTEVGNRLGTAAVGQRVRVLYDPADPAQVTVEEVERTAFAVIIAIGVIFAALLLTGLLLVAAG